MFAQLEERTLVSAHGQRGNQLRPRELWAAWETRPGPGSPIPCQPLRRKTPLSTEIQGQSQPQSKELRL